jgi:pilus assembly protein CpaB
LTFGVLANGHHFSERAIMRAKALMMLVAALGGMAGAGKLLPLRAQAPQQTVHVLVAKKKIALGTLIKKPEDFFKRARYVKGTEPKDALSEFAQVKDKRVIRALTEDEPIRAKDLMADLPLASRLPPNTVACSLKVSNAMLSSGFFLPHSRVDVIVTVRKNDKESESKVLMKNVLMMAVDDGEGQQSEAVQRVIVAVTKEQAVILRRAQKEGKLSLVLRPNLPEKKPLPKPAKGKGAQGLPKGKRAFALKVSSSAKLLATYKPGIRVDVVSEMRRGDDLLRQVILADVLILAVDRGGKQGDEKVALPTTVTLALEPRDAMLVTLAQDMGKVSLVVCPPKKTK